MLSDVLEVFAPSGTFPTRCVDCTRGGDFWRLPPELTSLRERWKERHPREWSGKRPAIERIDWSHPQCVRIALRPSEWMETRAWQDELAAHPGSLGEVIRRDTAGLECALPVFLVVHAVVVTADRRLVVSKRSPNVYYHPSTWSVSLEEGTEDADFDAGPDVLRATALRGIHEEFSVPLASLEAAESELLGIVIERALAAPAPVVLITIPLTASELAAHEPERSEVAALAAIPLEPAALEAWIRSVGSWHPTSRYRLLRVLERAVGTNEARRILGASA